MMVPSHRVTSCRWWDDTRDFLQKISHKVTFLYNQPPHMGQLGFLHKSSPIVLVW